MPVFKTRKGYYVNDITEILEENLRAFYSWGLLEMGAYTNIDYNTATSGYTNLRSSIDYAQPSGTVYEGTIGPSWIWQSGVRDIDGNSISFNFPTEVTSNNTNTYTSGFTVDYNRGRIITSLSGSLSTEYAIPDVDVITASSARWKRLLEYIIEDSESVMPSGFYSFVKEKHLWTPVIVIDPQISTARALELGSGAEIQRYLVDFHVISHRPWDAKRLADVIMAQDDKTIVLFNTNTAVYKPNYNGTLPSGIQEYPSLANEESEHYLAKCRMTDTTIRRTDTGSDIYIYDCSTYCEIYRYMSTY